MIYILSTLSLAFFVILSISQIESSASVFQVVRKSVFLFIVFSGSYAIGKIYCIEWGKLVKVEKKGTLLFLYERIFFPVVLLLFIIGATSFPHSIPRQSLHAYIIILFFLLGDWLGVVKATIARWYPGVSSLEGRKLFLQFPPKSRLDMIPMDFYFNFMLLFFIYKRFF